MTIRRVAALYDIHGNLPALELVLAEVAAADVDLIVIVGDVMVGPMSRQCLDALRALNLPTRFIRGNTDRLTVDAFDGRPLAVPAAIAARIIWTASTITREHRDFLAGLPLTVSLRLEALGDVLFCHASPRDDDEIFTEHSPLDRVLPMFEGVSEHVVVCGHTHIQFERPVGDVRVVNAGSVGMPFDRPGAYWTLLGPDVRLCRMDYDLDRAAERIRATAYPDREEFASRNVLDPPASADMIAAFEKAVRHQQRTK